MRQRQRRAATARTDFGARHVLGHRRGRLYRIEFVAASTRPGTADVAVNDMLGCDGSGATCRSAGSPISCRRPTSALARRPQARRRHPYRRDLGDHRDRRRPVIDTNFRLSLRLLDWCTATRTPFIYASSAATYGDGDAGFADDCSLDALKRLKPMNLYGWSKHLFDLAVIERARKGEEPAAAMGRARNSSTFRPERISQGRDDEPGRQGLRRRQGGQAGPAVQVAPRRHRRRRAAARLHLCRGRRRGDAVAPRDARASAASSMSAPARRAAFAT